MMLKGMTAEYLLRRTFKVEKGMNVLMHAAAGGVGLILCQWANYLGANVIGTVGSKDKAALAKANGCHHTILYRDEDFVARVKEITGGKLCDVVYDGVGKTTFPASLDCIRPLGLFASFGSSSGQIDAFNINILQQKGSLFATRPTLNTYAAKREDLLAIANDLFDVVGKGAVKIPINHKYRAPRRAAGAPRSRRARHHRLDHPGAVRTVTERNENLGLLGHAGMGGPGLSWRGSSWPACCHLVARGAWNSLLATPVRRQAPSPLSVLISTRSPSASFCLPFGSRMPIPRTIWRWSGRSRAT